MLYAAQFGHDRNLLLLSAQSDDPQVGSCLGVCFI